MRFARSTAWITSLAYLLASTLSGLLHSHAHGPAHPEVAGCHSHCDEPSADQALALADHGHDSSSPGDDSDEDCLACRFVAQSAIVSLPPPEPGRLPLVAELRSSSPWFVVEPLRSSALARAPPIG